MRYPSLHTLTNRLNIGNVWFGILIISMSVLFLYTWGKNSLGVAPENEAVEMRELPKELTFKQERHIDASLYDEQIDEYDSAITQDEFEQRNSEIIETMIAVR